MAVTNLAFNIQSAVDRFQRADTDTQIVILWCLSQQLHQDAARTTPAVFLSQLVQGLIRQVLQVPQSERLEALREIIAGANTRLSEAYDHLNPNMKLAFWYRLANSKRLQLPAPLTKVSRAELAGGLLKDLAAWDSNELVGFFHRVVLLTGSRGQ